MTVVYRKRNKARPTGPNSKLNKKQVKKIVKSAIKNQLEEHYYPYETGSVQAIGTTYAVFALSTIPQGITDVTRIGDEVKLTHMTLDLVAKIPTSYTTSTQCRIMIVQHFDLLDATTPPAWSGFMSTATSPYFLTAYVLPDLRAGVRILYDKVISFDLATQGGPCFHHLKKKIKIPRKKLEYIAASSTNQYNGIYMYALNTDNTDKTNITFLSTLFWLEG